MSLTRDRLAGAAAPTTAAPRLGGIDHIEFWVGNARASAAFFASAYGFEIVAYAGPETGVADQVSYVLMQGDVRFVVSAGLVPTSPSANTPRWFGHCSHSCWSEPACRCPERRCG